MANLLSQQPNRLSEAEELAKEALEIQKTLDPIAAKIWDTYSILANIADLQQGNDKAATYRRQARQSKAISARTRYEFQPLFLLIMLAVAATTDTGDNQILESHLEEIGRAHV